MITKFLVSTLFFAVALAVTVRAGENTTSAQSGMSDMPGMDHSMPDYSHMQWDNKNDIAFLSGMIVHHQGAITMTEDILKTTTSQKIRRWSDEILSAQRREVKQMEALLHTLGPRDEAAAAEMEAEMDMMMGQPMSSNADINFIEMMIPHHAGAIDMSVPALVMSDNATIRKLAEDIIIAQAREIAEFRTWLAQQGQTTASRSNGMTAAHAGHSM
ncbi:MAG: DUF305 domain-containing protein [Planctomycetaceae bacterium]|nr:DUF305 domain-containing protein [Planctomycetaceae bacterium]